MIKLIKNQKGSLGIALVVALIAVLSGGSLSLVAFRDVRSMRLQLDSTQQFHILRSEVDRGRLVASIYEGMDNPPPITTLPDRKINIDFGTHRTQYTARTKLNTYTEFAQTGFLIRSLITAVRGTGQLVSEEMRSPVKRYGENFIQSLQTLAIFHYFSDIDRALDDVEGNIRFYGADVVHGRVHSNTDIWIRNLGGWPTFTGLVTTSGEIKVYPGGGSDFPEDQIFQGGLIENYPRVVFDPTADLIRANGIRPFGHIEYDNRIAFVTVDGGAYESYIGNIVPGDTLVVYDSYPPYGPVGDSINFNVVPDTLWAPGPSGSVTNNSVWVPYELWISGTFAGRQSWGSAANIYLKDDIVYQGTLIGQPPDGGEDGMLPINESDYLGIISEKNIIIQYGHVHPSDDSRNRPNTNSIYIYAALCAMGEDDGPNQYGIHNNAGIFTFQYQFPKGSTPNQIWNGEMWEKIDLHRFRYPTSPFMPWPPGLDYPGYNPVWPEPGPVAGHPPIPNPHGTPTVVYLRGTINLFGSVAQRRRGYVRRSGNADYDTANFWDIEEGIYGLHSGALTPPGGASGYDKEYYFDTRFEQTGPPDFPLVKFEGYASDELMQLGYKTLSWRFKKPPVNF
jgi:hypothetical protein